MAESYTKTECKLHGTPYCAALNMKNCADCFASKLDSEQQEALIEDIGYIAAALPEDGIESFLDEPECMLCKGNEKGKPEFFAQLSMGHDHPTVDYLDEKSNKKYKRSTARLIPVQLPACRKCRSLLMQSYFVPIIVGVVFAAAGLVLTIIEPVRAALARFGAAIPFLFFLMFVFIGIIAESLLRISYTKRVERRMNTRASRIAKLSALTKLGWFPVHGSENGIRYTFTDKPLESGILTGRGQRELLDDIRSETSEKK